MLRDERNKDYAAGTEERYLKNKSDRAKSDEELGCRDPMTDEHEG